MLVDAVRKRRTFYLLKSSIFWAIKPCSPMKVNRCFGGTFCLHFRIEEQGKQETSMKQVASRAVLVEGGGDMFFGNICRLSADYTALCLGR
jgi:hypothetical protein